MLAAAILCTVPLALIVNSIVPEPYMDEIFHVPQAQCFCNFDFSTWDPMITTFPGLYVVSLGYKLLLQPWLTYFIQADEICTPAMLRSINAIFFLVCVILFREILIVLDPKKRPGTSSMKAMVLAVYPLHWFFTFLYYTDVGSTTAVMAMYLAALKKRFWISALFGGVSILFRQTNVVWTAFILCIGLIRFLQEPETSSLSMKRVQSDQTEANILRRRRKNPSIIGGRPRSSGILIGLERLVYRLWSTRREVLYNFLPLLVVILAFLVFTIYNGSIVVGAKDAHKMSPHFSQFLYFGLFAAAVLAPFHSVKCVILFRDYFRRRPVITMALLLSSVAISIVLVHFFSIAHPYLLADNRHYTFYIWKDVIQAHWIVKYLLVPCYLYSWWWIIWQNTGSTGNIILRYLWIFSFCGATMAVLVPAPLVELRYYTVPFYILALEVLSGLDVESRQVSMLGIGFAAVNAVTMYLFLLRPFNWPHEAGTQRFLW